MKNKRIKNFIESLKLVLQILKLTVEVIKGSLKLF